MHLLKEWAIVCQALGDGRQIFIARKGGISEEEGEFVLTNKEFFLFPTYLHQNSEGLKPGVHLELEMTSEPQDGKIHLKHFARVTDAWKVQDLSKLEKLRSEHIWSDRFLRQRFEWGNELGFHLLVLRVYRLLEEIILPQKKEYGGCKSWVTVQDERPLPRMSPVLSDEEFLRRRLRMRAL